MQPIQYAKLGWLHRFTVRIEYFDQMICFNHLYRDFYKKKSPIGN